MAKRMERTVQQDTITRRIAGCNAAISACEKAWEWQVALGSLAEMGERTFQQDTITRNAGNKTCEWLIAFCLVAKRIEPKKQQSNIIRIIALGNAAISVCEKVWGGSLRLAV